MSEKTRDILDTLLCGLYMAVFFAPIAFLSAGMTYDVNYIVPVIILCIFCGALSGTTAFSDTKTKAVWKWFVSLGFSALMFKVFINTNILLKIYVAIDPSYCYQYGEPSASANLGLTIAVVTIALSVLTGNIIGVSCSGTKLTQKGENTFAVLQKIVCPILCAVITGVTIYLLFALPQVTPSYG